MGNMLQLVGGYFSARGFIHPNWRKVAVGQNPVIVVNIKIGGK